MERRCSCESQENWSTVDAGNLAVLRLSREVPYHPGAGILVNFQGLEFRRQKASALRGSVKRAMCFGIYYTSILVPIAPS